MQGIAIIFLQVPAGLLIPGKNGIRNLKESCFLLQYANTRMGSSIKREVNKTEYQTNEM